MSEDSTPSTPNDDLKAKMREALERKQRSKDPSDQGAEHKSHERGHAEAHGPAAVKREHRRKSG